MLIALTNFANIEVTVYTYLDVQPLILLSREIKSFSRDFVVSSTAVNETNEPSTICSNDAIRYE